MPTPDGHLLLVLGDYTANTGPIPVLGYRPTDGHVAIYYDALRDERIEQYRVLNGGAMWTCPTDPMGREEATLAHSAPAGVAPWSIVTATVPGKGPAVHMFDVAQLANGDLFVCGTRGYTAAELAGRPGASLDTENNSALFVWRSTDGGATWSEDLVDYRDGDGFYRPYGFGQSGDDLVAISSDAAHWVRHAGTWSARRTSPRLHVGVPPIRSHDGLSFSTTANTGQTFSTTPDGVVVASTPSPTFGTALAAGPRGWLSLDVDRQVRYGDTTYGQIAYAPPGGRWTGCVIGDDVYLCDGVDVFRVDPPVPAPTP